MRRLALTAAMFALLAGAVLAYADLSSRSGPGHPAVSKHIRISGHVIGLYPGGHRKLRVKVWNGSRQRLVVRRLRVTVEDANPDCSRSNLDVPRFHGRRGIRPNRRRTFGLRVTMRTDAPEGCRGALFPLNYEAKFGRLP